MSREPSLTHLSRDVRGDFHTFAYEGPMFRDSVSVRTHEIVTKEGFVLADLI